METMKKSTNMLSEAREAAIALQETFRIALDTLRAHKLRTFLTLLGVILAVTTLVAVISVLNGLNLYVADKVANLERMHSWWTAPGSSRISTSG